MVKTSITAVPALLAAVLLTLALAGSVLAARNPAGTGQPGAECGDEGATLEPPQAASTTMLTATLIAVMIRVLVNGRFLYSRRGMAVRVA